MIELAQQGSSKATPYTTKSGLQIGYLYEPPRKNNMSQEDEHWQGVLLGEKPYLSAGRVVVFAAYCVLLAVIFAALAAVAGT